MVYDPAARSTKTVCVLQERGYDCPTKASEFIAWIQQFIATIPDEYRAAARVEIESEDNGYGGDCSCTSNLTVSYVRPETDAEWEDRLQSQRLRETEAERRERQKLAELKAKYESPSNPVVGR